MTITDATISVTTTNTPIDGFLDNNKQIGGTITKAFMSHAIYHDWNIH